MEGQERGRERKKEGRKREGTPLFNTFHGHCKRRLQSVERAELNRHENQDAPASTPV